MRTHGQNYADGDHATTAIYENREHKGQSLDFFFLKKYKHESQDQFRFGCNPSRK